MKTCKECGLEKPESSFYRRSGSQKRLSSCKDCTKLYFQKRRRKKGIPKKKVMKTVLDETGQLVSKECANCHQMLTVDNFGVRSALKSKLSAWCKECRNQWRTKYYDPSAAVEYHRQRKYNLSSDEYDKKVIEQNGRCAICGDPAVLVIDHNHATNKVRRLLCQPCNALLGMARESPRILEAAIQYLYKHNQSQNTSVPAQSATL